MCRRGTSNQFAMKVICTLHVQYCTFEIKCILENLILLFIYKPNTCTVKPHQLEPLGIKEMSFSYQEFRVKGVKLGMGIYFVLWGEMSYQS